MNLTYLTYKEIDKNKWDDCIRNSPNGLIYAESAYLDSMSANWDAIVLNDYEAVMPLTWKKKLAIRYLYQPAFLQQGGIFFRKPLPVETTKGFIDIVFRHFKFAEITFNYSNSNETFAYALETSMRNNFILKLGSGYENIYNNYDPYIRQRLSRLTKFSLRYSHSQNYSEAIDIYKELYHSRLPSFSTDDFLHFESLCKYYAEHGRVIIRHVHKQADDKLLSLILLLKDDKRIYNIISCILPEGKKLLANYFLYNEIIKEFADENIVLDFEGSDVPGIAYFYEKFSGENQPYPFVRFNRLPALVKLIKP